VNGSALSLALAPALRGARVRVLHDLSDAAQAAAFHPADDVVVGGRSSSRLEPRAGCAAFAGQLSLANGGGFAAVRTRPARIDLSAFDGLALRARGDGKRYRLELKVQGEAEGLGWQAAFDTAAGEWMAVAMPFSSFAPVWRGREMPWAERLDPRRLSTLGLLVADRQAGPFALEVAALAAFAGALDGLRLA